MMNLQEQQAGHYPLVWIPQADSWRKSWQWPDPYSMRKESVKMPQAKY